MTGVSIGGRAPRAQFVGAPQGGRQHPVADVVLVAPAAGAGRERGRGRRVVGAGGEVVPQFGGEPIGQVDVADPGFGLGVTDADLAVGEVDVGEIELGGLRDAQPATAKRGDQGSASGVGDADARGATGALVAVDRGRLGDVECLGDRLPGQMLHVAQLPDRTEALVDVGRAGTAGEIAGALDQRLERRCRRAGRPRARARPDDPSASRPRSSPPPAARRLRARPTSAPERCSPELATVRGASSRSRPREAGSMPGSALPSRPTASLGPPGATWSRLAATMCRAGGTPHTFT